MYVLDNHEKEQILTLLNNVEQVPTFEGKELLNRLSKKDFKKGELILREGQTEKHIKILLSGMVHQFRYVDGKQQTIRITLPGMTFCSFISYTYHKPSHQIQQTLKDSSIIYISKNDLDHLLTQCPTLTRIYIGLFEELHISREVRANIIQLNSSYERFKMFLQDNPKADEYMKKVPQKLIANFLGMTPEAFSKAKTKFEKEKC